MHNLTMYSVASSAARGAKRANVTTPIIFQMLPDGKYTFIDADNIPADDVLYYIEQNSNLLAIAPSIVEPMMARREEAAKTPAPVANTPAHAGVELPKKGEVVIPVSNRGSYKELARRAPAKSVVQNPVDIVWEFVAKNPDMPRKQAITALVNLGINLHTVKTQYQKAKSGKARFKKAQA
jgi:hypothetical protein